MNSDRLFLRERTKKVVDELLTLSTNEQLEFLGFDEVDILNIEIKYIKNNLSSSINTRKKWDLVDLKTQQVIGNCGFHNWYIEHDRAEVGYFIHPDYRRQGYMVEALKSIVSYGFMELNLNRIEAFISTENVASIKTVKKLGFSKEGILREHYKWQNNMNDSYVFSLLKSEYKKYL